MHLHRRLLGLCLGLHVAIAAALVFKPGDVASIPSWDIQSTDIVGTDMGRLSRPGVRTATWHGIDSPRCTLMGCLVKAGVYREDRLFFSNALESFDASQFAVPWVYRKEFSLWPSPGQHYHILTHGINSGADIYSQSGAYAGNSYDITNVTRGINALAVRVYPTDYNYDFALGFVDWNPYPPDNGTGVWRDIELKQTGPVMLGPLRVASQVSLPIDHSSAFVTLKATATNLENRKVTVDLKGTVSLEGSRHSYDLHQTVTIPPFESTEVALSTALDGPAIWWPKQWGEQPLYVGQLSASVDRRISDNVKRNFGIRQVTSELTQNNDTLFYVNGYPFQVSGAGYSSDIFLRWDTAKFETQAKMMLDLGLNTVRLEGKNEHPELYDIADRLGLMVLPGWECCDKWEAWTYNDNLEINAEWTAADYTIANRSMYHEAVMQQGHPSVLGYLVGSDFWPDDKAAEMYYYSLKAADWQAPIIASASERGYPEILGPSGLKMAGPYDWVPPNYCSLKKFLSKPDLDDLWKSPDKGLYHMSTNVSSFYDRKLYNDGLWNRYGAPRSLDDYLLKAQMMDYEATRSQFEGYSAFLHWNLFDYYLHPAGSYFGAKVGREKMHVAYNYSWQLVYLINHSLDKRGARSVAVDIIDKSGKSIYSNHMAIETEPNTSIDVLDLSETINPITDVAFLRLVLSDEKKAVLSRNVHRRGIKVRQPVVVKNLSKVPAFFIRLNLVDWRGEDVLPVFWSDNYVTLWPDEKVELQVQGEAAPSFRSAVGNIRKRDASLNPAVSQGERQLPFVYRTPRTST
ncbi:glycoside hydrolase family 2 protein [Hypoxylon sp. FL1284]|nr:glycoside hydrolase family 2 protein [Hypoxylon sp. FL1284]